MRVADPARHRVPSGYVVHGHAILSRDDMFADASGRTPPQLRNPADWRRFQAALDAAAVTVLGRLGHEAHPNSAPERRRRLVVSARAKGLERGDDAWWWNPAGRPFEDALQQVAPGGGIIAVPGGQRVFDLFLTIGYDEFHLARAERVTLRDGRTLFSGLTAERSAEDMLSGSGLVSAGHEVLDPAAGVTLAIWRRTSPRSRR
jgi:hypothetical protein